MYLYLIRTRCHHPIDAVLPAVRHRAARQLSGADRCDVRTAPASRLLLHVGHTVHHLRPDYAHRPDHVRVDIQSGNRLEAEATNTAAVGHVLVRVRPEFRAVRDRFHTDRNGGRAERVPVHWAATDAGGVGTVGSDDDGVSDAVLFGWRWRRRWFVDAAG